MKRTAPKSIFMAFILAFMFAAMLLPISAQAASKPKLNKTKATVYVGGSATLKVKGASGKVTWSTKNKKIATVSKSGKVTGKKAGKTTITAKVNKKSVKCTVTVKNPYLNATSKTLNLKKTFQLKLTGAKIKSCTSSDKKIAAVTKSGKVTAKKVGKAVISVKASNGKGYKCTITVKSESSSNNNPSSDDNSSSDNNSSEENNPSENNPSDENQPKDLAELNLKVDLAEQYTYTGREIQPFIRVYNDVLNLRKNVDYTVSYANNVNVGKGQLTISGTKAYKGEIIKEFEIVKAAQIITVDLPEKIYVGKADKINVSSAYGNLEFWATDEGIVRIDSDGTITGLRAGCVDIYLTASGDDNHLASIDRWCGQVSVVNEEASAYGFDGAGKSYNHYKTGRMHSRNSDGTNTFSVNFMCDSDEEWLDKYITSFEVEDVTPTAYANMFADMGIAYEEPKITLVGSAAEDIRRAQNSGNTPLGGGYVLRIIEPYKEGEVTGDTKEAMSGKCITVEAGPSVRVVKLTAKSGDDVLDYVYLASDGEDAEGNYSAYDLELYKQVRRKVEAQIWTDDMSNLEKLQALAEYISETTHYPDTDTTREEYNPTFWENWSVDGKELLYSMCDDVVLNRIMDLQGGITTCMAVDILSTAAKEDLGLPYLYDADTDVMAPGEGVSIAMGSYSSNPTNPYHWSLEYKSAEEKTTLIDAQGMGGSSSCEMHGCREKIVSLK